VDHISAITFEQPGFGANASAKEASNVRSVESRLVYLLFFLSGAAGLIYEISWARQIGLLFGHTVHAAAVVLAAYFAGMAIGYWLAGRSATRLQRPLLGYGIAEIAVALWALVTPFCFMLLQQPAIASLLNHPQVEVQTAIRVLVALLVLLPATVALGMTLPFVAQHLSPVGRSALRRIPLAYALNTTGAVAGVLVATFVLILFVGVTASSFLAAAISGACGVAACILAMRNKVPVSALNAHGSIVGDGETARTRIEPTWYWLAALSGAGTLGLQVLYTRAFALVLHNSTYTFGVVVALFLVSLAIGGALVARFGSRFDRRVVALASAAGAAAISVSAVVFFHTTGLEYFNPGGGFARYIVGVIGIGALVIVPPVVILGVILPYTWLAVDSGRQGPGSAVGRLTAVNTVAAAIGSLLTSFVLLPLLGLWACFALFATIYLVTSLVLFSRVYSWQRVAVAGVITFAIIVTNFRLTQRPVSVASIQGQVVESWVTPYGLLGVTEDPDTHALTLTQNLHYQLGNSTGAQGELRQGHLPLLLHPAPNSVLFLGLATGITASAALMHPGVDQIKVVELIPEVVEAAKHFESFNQDIVNHSRVQVIANDARHYLYASDRRFSVIVSDLFVPWHSQTGYLYTVEHYRLARKRLAPGGLYCQWLPLHQLGPDELTLIADSFAAAFPYTTVWRGGGSARRPLLALVGSDQPLRLDESVLQQRVKSIASQAVQPDPLLDDARDILELYIGDWVVQRDDHLNTDEHPRVEFLAPVSHRNELRLTKGRLRQYYRAVFDQMPVTNLTYLPSGNEQDIDLTAGRTSQAQRLKLWRYRSIGDYFEEKNPPVEFEQERAMLTQKLRNLEDDEPLRRAELLIAIGEVLASLERGKEAWNVAREAFDIYVAAKDWEGAAQASNVLFLAEQPESPRALAQGIWLGITRPIDPELTVVLLERLIEASPPDADLTAVAATTAVYIATLRGQGEAGEELKEFTDRILSDVARRQANVRDQAGFDTWFENAGLNNPRLFLRSLAAALATLIGEDWWFDRYATR
jgi:spermidine synthase